MFLYSGTRLIADYQDGTAYNAPSREHFYSSGQWITTDHIAAGVREFRHHDHLSLRLTTDSTGAWRGHQGHYPFGEDTWYASQVGVGRFKFTTYERDGESGNDYAIMRYHVNRLGRFSSPDPLAGSITNPQSLNRSAYVLNDPPNLIDPLGLWPSPWEVIDFLLRAGCQPNWERFTVTWACALNGSGGGDGNDCSRIGDCAGGGPGGGTGEIPPPAQPSTIQRIIKATKVAYCSATPSGRAANVTASAGTLGGVTGSLERVVNFDSGQISGFASGGGFVGFNGGGSVSGSGGVIFGNLNGDNSNYSGPFTSGAVSVGPVGVSIASSSGGASSPLSLSGPVVVSGSVGISLYGPFTSTIAVTRTSQPLQMGNVLQGVGTPSDIFGYLLRRPCS